MIGSVEAFERYAVVPGGDGDSVVVVDGRLPCVRGELWRQPDVLDRLEPLVGRPTFLRTASQAKTADGRTLPLLRGRRGASLLFAAYGEAGASRSPRARSSSRPRFPACTSR